MKITRRKIRELLKEQLDSGDISIVSDEKIKSRYELEMNSEESELKSLRAMASLEQGNMSKLLKKLIDLLEFSIASGGFTLAQAVEYDNDIRKMIKELLARIEALENKRPSREDLISKYGIGGEDELPLDINLDED